MEAALKKATIDPRPNPTILNKKSFYPPLVKVSVVVDQIDGVCAKRKSVSPHISTSVKAERGSESQP